MNLLTHQGRTKAGREMIARVLRYATHVRKDEIDLVTDEVTHRSLSVELLGELVAASLVTDARSIELVERDPRTFVWLTSGTPRYVYRYVITTSAMAE